MQATVTNPATPSVSRRRAKAFVRDGFFYVLMTAVAVVTLLPLIWMISSSLKTEDEVFSVPPSFVPSDPRFENYPTAFASISGFLWNSTYLAVLNVVGLLVVSSLAGYAFARIKFVGRDILFMILLSTAIIPSIVYLVPQYIVFLKFGWIDTHYPLWVPRVLTPVFPTFLMRQFFKTLPRELEEAARIDGASTFTTFWRIMLPQVKPALAAVGVLTFIESWNDLFGPLIFINSQELQTLPVALALFQGEFFTQTNLLMAAAAMTVLPVLFVYLLVQKYFIQGIALSGLKA